MGLIVPARRGRVNAGVNGPDRPRPTRLTTPHPDVPNAESRRANEGGDRPPEDRPAVPALPVDAAYRVLALLVFCARAAGGDRRSALLRRRRAVRLLHAPAGDRAVLAGPLFGDALSRRRVAIGALDACQRVERLARPSDGLD